MGTITSASLVAARKMTPHKRGAWFEAHVYECLSFLKEHKKVDWFRLYDTKSAGAYLPAQPADAIVAGRDDVYLLELKCSNKYKSLRGGLSSLFGMRQAVSHFTWNRAGHRSHILFLSTVTGELQLWDGGHVAQCRRHGDRLDEKSDGLLETTDAFALSQMLQATYCPLSVPASIHPL